jgi:hypothetical protein
MYRSAAGVYSCSCRQNGAMTLGRIRVLVLGDRARMYPCNRNASLLTRLAVGFQLYPVNFAIWLHLLTFSACKLLIASQNSVAVAVGNVEGCRIPDCTASDRETNLQVL